MSSKQTLEQIWDKMRKTNINTAQTDAYYTVKSYNIQIQKDAPEPFLKGACIISCFPIASILIGYSTSLKYIK